jgi:hypothetical protein
MVERVCKWLLFDMLWRTDATGAVVPLARFNVSYDNAVVR